MNQEEIKKEIEKLDSFRSDCEGKMVTLSAALDEFIKMVAALEAQLAEAEKPELRHGNYGQFADKSALLLTFWNSDENKMQYAYKGSEDGEEGIYEADEGEGVWFGNIFDDLKALSEPLYNFTADVHPYGFDFKQFPQAPIQIAGNWHTLKEAKQISTDIQRVIFTAEQEAAK